MKHKVAGLEGAMLDVAALMAEDAPGKWSEYGTPDAWIGVYMRDGKVAKDWAGAECVRWTPSTNWAQGGPILEREDIALVPLGLQWGAMLRGNAARGARYIAACADEFDATGPTMLVAGLRAYVIGRLGPEVELPDQPLPAIPHRAHQNASDSTYHS
jgi:hypothetical protein